MELRDLNAFLTVAEERHFGRAADRLGISQPPLSRQIQRLEAELGLKLFTRTSRQVSLTKEGTEFLNEIRPHVEGLDQAVASMHSMSREPHAKVRVGHLSNLVYRFIPRLTNSLRQEEPGVQLEFNDLPTPEQIRSLRERRIDVGIVMFPLDDSGFEVRTLFREELVAMVSTRHPLAVRERIALADLANESFVMCPQYELIGFHEVVMNVCRSAGFEPKVHSEASTKAMITELVVSGGGVSLVPESGTQHEHPGIVYLPITDSATVQVAAIWLREAMTPVLRVFLNHAVRAGGKRH